VNLAPLGGHAVHPLQIGDQGDRGGFWGVPTLCSPTPDTLRFHAAGAHVAATPQDWRELLDRLCLDTQAHAEATHRLRERVLACDADIERLAQRWLAAHAPTSGAGHG